MGGCMGQWVGSGQMTNLIKLELIDIIWFCLKIYNLSRHPYLWVDGWVNGWAHVKPLKSNKSWPNWDNSIMDILDILLDILLKPPQPFIGLFLPYRSGLVLSQNYWPVCHAIHLAKRVFYQEEFMCVSQIGNSFLTSFMEDVIWRIGCALSKYMALFREEFTMITVNINDLVFAVGLLALREHSIIWQQGGMGLHLGMAVRPWPWP